MIFEVFGGIAPHSAAYIARLAARARKNPARDSTKYGESRLSARSFFTHHAQQLSAAAQLGDAKGIRASITGHKMAYIKKAFKAGARAKA